MNARQFRIHTSHACHFFIRALSRPIIEHSTALVFSPNPLAHPMLRRDCEAGGLGGVFDNGMWENVDDFGWHRCVKGVCTKR